MISLGNSAHDKFLLHLEEVAPTLRYWNYFPRLTVMF